MRKNPVCVILTPHPPPPGLSLQEAAAQAVYQVRGNSKEARWARRGTDPPREQEVEWGSNPRSLSRSAR